MASDSSAAPPEGVFSLLDTDLYKLTMQSCVLKYFPTTNVTYKFTNRTPDMKFSRESVNWLQTQIDKLANITLSADELAFLRSTCSYLSKPYLDYLSTFRLKPSNHIRLSFHPERDTGSGDDIGDIDLQVEGMWLETILYEIPLLALVSETYFRFMDRDWQSDDQYDRAVDKGIHLIKGGCIFSEFGSRRRRDYKTQDTVLRGLVAAAAKGEENGWPGKLSGTSNVHFAMKYGIPPIGTVAHEWFMGVAAITDNYEGANELALRYWVGTFGEGVLGIALTDTFGTDDFLKAFAKQVPRTTTPLAGASATAPSSGVTAQDTVSGTLSATEPPIDAAKTTDESLRRKLPTYAQVFTGTRQDSGDPTAFVQTVRRFYDEQGIADKKTVVFSDSLNIERCLEYKQVAESAGLQPSFGVGTFLTNDFVHSSTGKKSVPLNIVIKLSSAEGSPAVKISDNIGKNTGDSEKVAEVKRRLGYTEHQWKEGDESKRWGKEDE